MGNEKDDDKSPFRGALEDQLEDLDIEPSERRNAAEPERDQREPPAEPESPDRQPDRLPRAQRRTPPPDDEELSEEELFERAVEQLDPEEIYRGKFEGEGASVAPDSEQPTPNRDKRGGGSEGTPSDSVDEERARREVAHRREKLEFERAVGPVEKNERREKYRAPRVPDPAEARAAGEAETGELVTPPLAKSGEGLHQVRPLAPAHRDLLERFDKRDQDPPELNVRGDGVDDAIGEIESFVARWAERSARFVRIIHGRGLRSKGPPVLKPAVLRWIEGPAAHLVRGYAPEVNRAGDYGSIIVELRRT